MQKGFTRHHFVDHNVKSGAGFTLVEMLIVIAIVGTLGGVVYFSIQDARGTGDDAKREADIQQLELALKLYRNIYDKYPDTANGSLDALDILVQKNFIGEVPNDPNNDGSKPDWSDEDTELNAYYYWNADDVPECGATGYVIWYHLAKDGAGNAPDTCFGIEGVNSNILIR